MTHLIHHVGNALFAFFLLFSFIVVTIATAVALALMELWRKM